MTRARLLVALALVTAWPAATAAPVAWPNRDFELGDATWTLASTTRIVDAAGDLDKEARLVGCGDGTWLISRGATKGVVPASTKLELDVERGQLDVFSFRMILLKVTDPEPWVNNVFYLDSTGTVSPNWTDDDVLAWEDWQAGAVAGHVILDPVEADAYNIDGWASMTAAELAAELQSYTHMTLVVYGCASGYAGGAALDNFAWSV